MTDETGRLRGILLGRPAFVAVVVAAALLLAIATAWGGDWTLTLLSLVLGALALRGAVVPEGQATEAVPEGQSIGEEGADLLRASPDPVVTVDKRGVVRAANAAARALIPSIKAGEPLAFALRAPEVLDAIRAVATNGEPRDVEYGGLTATEPLVAVRARAIPTRPGGLPAIALFFSDRTRERRVETMRVDFIATVSHELRTPLASLTGFIDTIAGPARNDIAAQDRFLVIMREQAQRMTRLVDDLLQLSRVELNEHVAPTGSVDLSALAAHMSEIMTPLGRERGVTLRCDLAEGLPPVRGERDQLLRVIENLIENAMKYGGPGEVAIRTRRSDDRRSAILSVADKGPGIAAEHIPRLTERFYRVDEAESRARGGTGLGLAIVKHVVGRHRGRMTIDSAPGRGTTVTIQIPIAEDAKSGRR